MQRRLSDDFIIQQLLPCQPVHLFGSRHMPVKPGL
jgi:hypothetical protein